MEMPVSNMFAYKRYIVAKANEIATGGNQYYKRAAANCFENANLSSIDSAVLNNKVENRLSKMKEVALKALRKSIPSFEGKDKMQFLTKLAERVPENTKLQELLNIHKHFAK